MAWEVGSWGTSALEQEYFRRKKILSEKPSMVLTKIEEETSGSEKSAKEDDTESGLRIETNR